MAKKKSRSKKIWRRWSQNVHLWIGLALCLPLAVMGITGSILVFEHEIEDALNPPKIYTLTKGEPHNVSAIVETANIVAKPDYTLFLYRAGDEHRPASVMFSNPSRQRQFVLVDPVSLNVLDVVEREPGILRTIFKLHANLLIDGRTGRQIIGWFGIFLLAMTITGLVIWWARNGQWKAAFMVKQGKRGIKGMRFNRDLHGASGIWFYLVLFVTAFSGVYLAFPDQTGLVIRTIFPARDLRAARTIQVQPMEQQTPLTVDEAITVAGQAMPEGTPTMVRFPSKPDQPYRIMLGLPERTSGPSATVWVDPWKKKAVEIQDPRQFTVGETIMAWQRALHGGHGTDWLWWKILLVIAGFLPLLFAITGVYMWWLKRQMKP